MQKWEYCSLTVGEEIPPDALEDDRAIGYCHLDVYTKAGRQREEIASAEYLFDPRGHFEKVGTIHGENAEQVIEEHGERQSLLYDRYHGQLAELGAEGWEMVSEVKNDEGETRYQTTIWFKRPLEDTKQLKGSPSSD